MGEVEVENERTGERLGLRDGLVLAVCEVVG